MPVILALDPGERRTGIALSDSTGTLARPLQTHDRKRDGSLMTLLAQLVAQHGAVRILVGLPLTQMGERGSSAVYAERLAAKVRDHVDVPVIMVDERYTSVAADGILRGQSDVRQRRDAVAAAVLLQDYLDGGHGNDKH